MAYFLTYRRSQRRAEPHPLAIMERLFNGDDLVYAYWHTGGGVEGEAFLVNYCCGTAARNKCQSDAADNPFVFAME